MKQDILIVEDDLDMLDVYSINLASKEYNIMKARNLRQALKLLEKQEFAVVATDLFLGEEDASGFDILVEVHKKRPYTQVIIFTGLGGKMDGLDAMQQGAYTYVTKDKLDFNHFKQTIKNAIKVYLDQRNASQSPEIESLPFPEIFVGSSKHIMRVLSQVANVIKSKEPVLIVGATGTGKALIAETIHLGSEQKRLVLVNCASYSETTLERILFGFKKGAFRGATEDEMGLLEQASGGTLVLDRVNDLSPRLQRSLFLALQDGRGLRVRVLY